MQTATNDSGHVAVPVETSTDPSADARRLRAIFIDRQAKDPSLTQKRLANLCGWTHQSAAQQYLAGKIPLNFNALITFSELFGVSPSKISPTMGARLVKCIANHEFDDLVKALQRARDDLEDTAVLVKQGLAQRENILRSIEIKVNAACAALTKAGVK